MIELYDILDVENHLDGIEAVIFDLDDTLYSEKDYVRSGYRAIAECFCEIPTAYEELLEAFEKKEPAIDVVLGKYNLMSRKDEALKIYRFHTPDISLYPGVREMIDRISRAKKIAIVTDGRPEGQRAKLQALGLSDIRCIITDELGGVKYRKPCEKAFVMICEGFGVEYSKAVYIGDNINKDFVAPEKLGMKTVYFKNDKGLYQ